MKLYLDYRPATESAINLRDDKHSTKLLKIKNFDITKIGVAPIQAYRFYLENREFCLSFNCHDRSPDASLSG